MPWNVIGPGTSSASPGGSGEGARAMVTARPLSFAAHLKRLRRAAGLTQEQLAARAGYSVSYLGQLERGVRLPVRPTAELLGRALGVDPDEQAALLGALPAPGPPPAAANDAPPAAPLVGRARELA